MLIEVKVGALIMDPNSNTPIIVLKEIDGEAILPIWVGGYEANAIAHEIEKFVSPRPMTHDLLRNIITEFGCKVERIIVSDLVDNTFLAVIEIAGNDGKTISIDARPSDAIALAMRTDCRIFVAKKVVEISNLASTQINPLDEIGSAEGSVDSPEEWPDLIG